ncbi:MAG TPA: phosphoglucosamine mutase, partial [Mizugakiibacter sp.]|nr:phosphoglucosamine mutase [Mizugakiibacter sp.]
MISPPRKYFGTDGIRGSVGEWPVTPDCMLHLGHAAGRVLGKGQEHPLVLIGKDTRVSGYMFESALEAGLVSAGADVRLLGPLPTPAVSWLTRSMPASAGIVISASHNPYTDNGVKFFGPDGEKLADPVERDLETMLEQPLQTVASCDLGKVSHLD